VWDDGDDLLLDCETAAADDLVRRLAIYRLRRPIGIERDDSRAVHWSAAGDDGVPDPRLPALGNRWVASSSPAQAGAQSGEADLNLEEEALRASGLLPSQENKWLEHRLRLGVCEGRAEVGDLLWLECNAAELNGVSFSKGCFVGQENTARMNWRAKVNRRLVVIETSSPGPRTRVHYPELGLAVEHRRTDDLKGAIIPGWLAEALAQPSTA
jgi:tRNA-modifying protein YgfZ